MKKKNNKFILFLNNRYPTKDSNFYLAHLENRTTIAVDGGVRFFIKNKRIPDYLLGDFDSAPRIPRALRERTTVITHPARKNKTDSQLAVELALANGAGEILICGAVGCDEIDHTLGNIFLLELVSYHAEKTKSQINTRLIHPQWEIFLAKNETVSITGQPGQYLSILPLSSGVRLEFMGLSYPAPKRALIIGDTISLRNQLIKSRARIKINGKALIIKSDNN